MERKYCFLASAALALALTACGGSGSGRKADAGLINEFQVSEILMTADKDYRISMDYGDAYLELYTSIHWPERLGSNDISVLQDSLLYFAYGDTAVHLHEPLRLHPLQLPHHGAAVRADVVRQGAEGEGQGEAVRAGGQPPQLKPAHELVPDAPAAEDLHPLAQLPGLLRHQPEHVLHQLAVVGAGILAPLHDVAVLHEQHLAAGGAHHLHAVPQGGKARDSPNTPPVSRRSRMVRFPP